MSASPYRRRPATTESDVRVLLKTDYNIDAGDIKELVSYDDRNYQTIGRLPDGSTEQVLLKIINAVDSQNRRFIKATTDLLLHVPKDHIPVTVPLANLRGEYTSYQRFRVDNSGQEECAVRLMRFLPGSVLTEVKYTPTILFEFGALLAQLDQSMSRFAGDVDVFKKKQSSWSLLNSPSVVDYLYVLKNESHQQLVKKIMDQFKVKFLDHANEYDWQLVHADMNGRNLIVKRSADGKWRAFGFIDFNDTIYAPKVVDLAIMIAYAMIETNHLNPIDVPRHVIAGFLSVQPLADREFEVIPVCIKARIAQSLVLGAFAYHNDPSNEYVLTTTRAGGWQLLERLDQYDEQTLVELCKV